MSFAVIAIFALGVLNFALHRAILESRHALLDQIPSFINALSGKLTLAAEFVVLLAALLLAANGWPELAWGYLAYSMLNVLCAWFLLSRRL